MKIDVEFVGAINTGPYDKKQEFEVDNGKTVGEFLATLHFDKSHLNFIQVLKNGTRCSHNETLSENDKLELMLMVGGG
ncbi:MAG: MoaD/ThiS family protein [Candidatus Rifleibacteriota bacterium]